MDEDKLTPEAYYVLVTNKSYFLAILKLVSDIQPGIGVNAEKLAQLQQLVYEMQAEVMVVAAKVQEFMEESYERSAKR